MVIQHIHYNIYDFLFFHNEKTCSRIVCIETKYMYIEMMANKEKKKVRIFLIISPKVLNSFFYYLP